MNLLPVSRLLANAALSAGGSDMFWHKAIFCPYTRDDGSPCYDESRGVSWIECPICGGEGAVYDNPKLIKGIYSDKSNEFVADSSGGFIRGDKTLSLSPNLGISLMKPRFNDKARRFLRDKFQLLGQCCEPDGSREIVETMYLDDDTVKPTVSSGTIYQVVRVRNNA
jgi:hypothetical protein